MRRASDIATSDSLTALYTTAEAAALLLREATDSELLGARCAVTEAAYYLSDTIEPDDRGRLLVAATRQLEPPPQRDPAGAALSLVSDASGEVERLLRGPDASSELRIALRALRSAVAALAGHIGLDTSHLDLNSLRSLHLGVLRRARSER